MSRTRLYEDFRLRVSPSQCRVRVPACVCSRTVLYYVKNRQLEPVFINESQLPCESLANVWNYVPFPLQVVHVRKRCILVVEVTVDSELAQSAFDVLSPVVTSDSIGEQKLSGWWLRVDADSHLVLFGRQCKVQHAAHSLVHLDCVVDEPEEERKNNEYHHAIVPPNEVAVGAIDQ